MKRTLVDSLKANTEGSGWEWACRTAKLFMVLCMSADACKSAPGVMNKVQQVGEFVNVVSTNKETFFGYCKKAALPPAGRAAHATRPALQAREGPDTDRAEAAGRGADSEGQLLFLLPQALVPWTQ